MKAAGRAILGSLALLLASGCGARPEKPAASATDGAATILLNEVAFHPKAGATPWVELKNAGTSKGTLDGFSLENNRGQRWKFPAELTVDGGAFLNVPLDGRTGPAQFISGAGSLTLRRGETEVDRVEWSDEGMSPYVQARGGYSARLRAGSTIGRVLASLTRSSMRWTTYSPQQATPGAANPLPRVEGMLPMSGAMLRDSQFALAWYTVPGAKRYRVQLARQRSFSTPDSDRQTEVEGDSLTMGQIAAGALSAGRYFWRVQAIYPDGATSDFSEVAHFWIGPARNAAHSFSFGLVPDAYAQQSTNFRKVLPVPLILQHKDTRLLALEAPEDGDKRWDAPWPKPSGPYCARASIAMVTAFFRGNVSQDRITHEAFKGFKQGPIFDIYVKNGFGSQNIRDGIKWALGLEPTLTFSETQSPQQYFDQFKSEIDRGKPILATSSVHAWVVTGYGQDERGSYLVVNDSAIGQYDYLVLPAPGVEDADLQNPAVADSGIYAGLFAENYFFPGRPRGRDDEPEVQIDSDGDGVMDWDETVRFGTDPRNKDSDGDGVNDKQDIRAWVFDADKGWSSNQPAGRSFDEDGDDKWGHVDADSDAGGCLDGIEDRDVNGTRARQTETWTLEKKDDSCISGTFETVTETRLNDGRDHYHHRHVATISLIPGQNNTFEGVASETWHLIDLRSVEPTSGCVYNLTRGQPFTFQSKFSGRIEPQPDGNIKVSFTPNFDPATRPQYNTGGWKNFCQGASGPFSYPVPFLSLGEITLVDGKYTLEQSSTPPGFVRLYTKIHLEQKKEEQAGAARSQ